MLPRKLQARLEKTADMALAAYKAQDFGLAVNLITQSGLEAHSPDINNMKGVFLSAAGQVEASLESFTKALALKPDFVEALSNKGNALQKLGRLTEALPCYDRAIALRPIFPDGWSNRGGLLQKLERKDEALADFDKAIALQDGFAKAWHNKAVLLFDMNRLDEALDAARGALQRQPNYPDALVHLATILHHKRDYAGAMEAIQQALRLRPNFPEALSNLSAVLRETGRPAEALEAVNRALSLDPRAPKALSNKGAALIALSRFEEAREAYAKALNLLPDFPDLRFNHALLLLQLGDYAAGFAEYEHRWARRDAVPKILRTPLPEWQGEDLTGKTLLVYSEQGFGDVLQFARFLPRLRQKTAARLVFLGDPRLKTILADVLGDIPLVHPDTRPEGDCAVALMSLPHRLGVTLDTLPARTPYLSIAPDRIAQWRERIGTEGLRIGVVWQGNPTALIDQGRSYPARALLPLAALPGARLISLQKTHGLNQLAALPEGLRIETLDGLDEGPDAFADTAAVMMSCDLVVSSDTSVAHLAGAMGRPTFVALKKSPDWRWLLEREDCPWYPSLRLFRQTNDGDWDGVFARMADAMRERPHR